MTIDTMKRIRQQPTAASCQAGFTLVEVALAVLVVALGVLAVFGLLSAGLDQSAKAIAETEGAIFADNVFHGLGAESLALAETPTTTAVHLWEDFWEAAAAGGVTIPVTAPDMWESPDTLEINTDGNIHANEYMTSTARGTGVSVPNHTIRYRINVELAKPVGTLWYNIAMVTIEVWRGKFGSTDEPMIFYEEFANPGDL